MPSITDNAFTLFTLPELAVIQADYKQCLLDIANAGQSYTQGRQFTRADLPKVRNILSEVNIAIKYVSGLLKTTANVNISQQGYQ